MSFVFKNTQVDAIKVYLEPSTDEVTLSTGDELRVTAMLQGDSEFEFHLQSNTLVIWIPRGESASLMLNGKKLDSFSEHFVW
jgi:hypothetical protein